MAEWGHRMSRDVGQLDSLYSVSSLSSQSEFTNSVKGEILPFPLWNTEVLCDDKWMDFFSAEVSNSHIVARGRKKSQHFGSNKQPFAFKNASRFFFSFLKKFLLCVCVYVGRRVIFSFLLLGRRRGKFWGEITSCLIDLRGFSFLLLCQLWGLLNSLAGLWSSPMEG